MTIKVLMFAQLKEIFGRSDLQLEIAEGKTVGHVVEALGQEYRVGAFGETPLFFAVNEEYVQADHALSDGDTLACLMPMSGGAL